MKTIAVLCGALVALRPSPAPAGSAEEARAREHVARAETAYDARRYVEAVEEYEAAYRLTPRVALLYNIGLVDQHLGRAVEAVAAFEAYLAGATVSPARRQDVRHAIEQLEARVGTLAVRTRPAAAEVRVDGKRVDGRVVRLNAGAHTVEAVLRGHSPAIREVAVTGRAQVEIDLALDPVVVPVVVPPPPPPPPPLRRAWQPLAGYAGVGVGAVLAAVGAGLALRSAARADGSRALVAQTGTPAAWDRGLADYQAARSQNRLAWTLIGVGAAVVLAGSVALATSPSGEKPTLASWLAPGGGGLSVQGRF